MKAWKTTLFVLVIGGASYLWNGCVWRTFGTNPPTNAEVRALYAWHSRATLGERGCIERPDTLDNVVLIAPFVHDYGCSLQAVMVDGRWFESTEEAGMAILSSWNWSTLDETTRRERARRLVAALFHTFGPSMLESSRPAFDFEDTPDFHPPKITTEEDGTVVVRLWVRKPPGRIHTYTYRRVAYRFSPEGRLRGERLETFSVDGARVQEKRNRWIRGEDGGEK